MATSKETAFNRAYHLSLDPDRQRLREIGDAAERIKRADELYRQSKDLDLQIDVWQWGAYSTMKRRVEEGVSQVEIYVPGGATPPNPMRFLKVSLNLADFPAFTPPRHYDDNAFFALQSWLNANEIYTGNEDRKRFMPAGTSVCEPSQLDTTPEAEMEGALPNWGLVINGTGKAFDCETLDLIRKGAASDEAAVKAIREFIAPYKAA